MGKERPAECCPPEHGCPKPDDPGMGKTGQDACKAEKRQLLRLPGNMDAGDLLLILILLLIWLEKEDEEILILLSALLVMSL